MKDNRRRILLFLFVLITMILSACCKCDNNGTNVNAPLRSETAVATNAPLPSETAVATNAPEVSDRTQTIEEDGSYTSKDEVALYIHTYGRLPNNFITKKEAEKLGWNSKQGNLTSVAPGKSIGGSHFGNYEGQLPDRDGRNWTECDIDYTGGHRNAKRIVFSDDGLIYYTEDHYETFELLYE